MDTEVTAQIGADADERTGERTAYRNGSRPRTWDTRVGTPELAIPKGTPGTYFPALLEPRRRGERALVAVGQEADCPRRLDPEGRRLSPPAWGRSIGPPPRLTQQLTDKKYRAEVNRGIPTPTVTLRTSAYSAAAARRIPIGRSIRVEGVQHEAHAFGTI